MKKVIFWLFAALFFFVPLILWPYTSEVFEFNKMVLVYILTTLIASSWLIRAVIEKKWIYRRTILDTPLLILLGSQLISTVLSIDPRTSWLGYYSRFNGGLLSVISYSILYWAFVSNLEKDHVVKLFKYSILPSAILVSIYAVAEHFGIDKSLWVQDVQLRVFSTLGQPNWLAAWLTVIIPTTWAFMLGSEHKDRKFFIYLAISILFFWTLIFTKSRSGLFGFGVAALLFWGIHFWQKLRIIKKSFSTFLLIGVPILVVILLSGTPWTPSLSSLISQPSTTTTSQPTGPALEVGGTESGTIRKIVWKGALDIWKNYPVFGTGVETFAYSYYQFRPKEHNLVSEWDFIYNKAHNEYLNLMANTGTVGIISYLALVVFSIFQISGVKNVNLRQIQNLNLAFLVGYSSLLISNFFGFSVVPTQLELFLIPAFAFVISAKNSIPDSTKQKSEITQYIGIFFALCFAFYLLLTVGKYWYADTLYAKGKGYNGIQKSDVAASYLIKAVHLSPQEGLYHNELSSAYSNIALAFDEQKETEKVQSFIDLAISESDKATSLSPSNLNFKRTRFGMFIMLSTIDTKYLADALKTVGEATKYAPTDAKIFYHLALTLARTGQVDQSIEIFKKTIDLKPNYKEPRIALAILLDEKKQSAEAKAQLNYILENIDPNDSLTKQTLEGIK